MVENKIDPDYIVKLQELAFKAVREDEIYSQFKTLLVEMKQLKVVVVDAYGNDTINRDVSHENIKKIRSCCFECDNLVERKYSEKHRAEILELKARIEVCSSILSQWLELEKKFLIISRLYEHNEEVVYASKFSKISDLHRRAMKSLDIDNSVWQLYPNKFLINSLPLMLDQIEDIQSFLFEHIRILQVSCPRLYFLSKE